MLVQNHIVAIYWDKMFNTFLNLWGYTNRSIVFYGNLAYFVNKVDSMFANSLWDISFFFYCIIWIWEIIVPIEDLTFLLQVHELKPKDD